MNYFKLLEHFSEATDLPISIFEQENLIFKGHRDKQDYNIPMFLLECLPRELPDIWISSTPETLFSEVFCFKHRISYWWWERYLSENVRSISVNVSFSDWDEKGRKRERFKK